MQCASRRDAASGQAFGTVTEDELDAIVDASGFAFGDQHPLRRTVQFAENVERWKAQGKPVVLLPQALGPFKQPEMRAAFARVLKAADLVYAREPESMNHARSACPDAASLREAPDITNLVKPLPIEEVGQLDRACIIPNQRMIEKAKSKREVEAYVPMLVAAIRAIEGQGVESVMLVHGEDDIPLVEEILSRLGKDLPVISETDPIKIKAELGRSRLVFGSRFHALVGALSQGVPAIGTSWSHKYEMLFANYSCPDLILPVTTKDGSVKALIDHVLGARYSELVKKIRLNARQIEDQVRAMWREVDQTLGFHK